jgi:cephalosporin-C deacetylase-like acetyl esterase
MPRNVPSRRRVLVAALAAGSLAAASRAGDDSLFDYDRARPLDVRESEVALRNVSYADASGQRAEATVVAPVAAGRHPGVLFVHWYEEPAQNADRTQFLPDALALARRGVASLLVDTPWSAPEWFNTRDPADDLAMSVRQVKALRRQLDVLASLDQVDPMRIAFVGHDFGAMFGAVVASVDRRPKALVFVAGTVDFSDWYLLGRKLDAAARRKVEQELAPLAPVRHVARVAPAALLFQFARKDPYVPREAADALVSAASDPKEARFYDCGHEMNRDAMRDRVDWLVRTLDGGVGKP